MDRTANIYEWKGKLFSVVRETGKRKMDFI